MLCFSRFRMSVSILLGHDATGYRRAIDFADNGFGHDCLTFWHCPSRKAASYHIVALLHKVFCLCYSNAVIRRVTDFFPAHKGDSFGPLFFNQAPVDA